MLTVEDLNDAVLWCSFMMPERVLCEQFQPQDHEAKLSGFIPPELLTRLSYSAKKKSPWGFVESYVKDSNKV